MIPIGNAKGITEILNIRLECLSDDELQKTVDEIKNNCWLWLSRVLHVRIPSFSGVKISRCFVDLESLKCRE